MENSNELAQIFARINSLYAELKAEIDRLNLILQATAAKEHEERVKQRQEFIEQERFNLLLYFEEADLIRFTKPDVFPDGNFESLKEVLRLIDLHKLNYDNMDLDAVFRFCRMEISENVQYKEYRDKYPIVDNLVDNMRRNYHRLNRPW